MKPLWGEQTRNQPAWKTISKESWCRCAAALTMGYQLNHVCNKPKAFELERIQHDVITWLFHFEETLNTEKPFTQKTFSNTICELKGKTPSLTSGKVTLPRGKLECRSCYAETSRNQTLVVDLGAVLPGRASGCVGCRRKGNTLVRITGCKLEDRGGIQSLLKGNIVHLGLLERRYH